MTNSTQVPKAQLLAGIASLSTEQIREGVNAIGGGHVEQDQRVVRAYLIEELITREGVESGDALMDQLGM